MLFQLVPRLTPAIALVCDDRLENEAKKNPNEMSLEQTMISNSYLLLLFVVLAGSRSRTAQQSVESVESKEIQHVQDG